MERPEPHILEEESRAKFELILPRSWIKRSQFPDYHYDFDVQIVNDNTLTPFHFYVQLKSTNESAIIEDGFPQKLETKRFEVYSQGHFPVMLCLYIKNEDSFFYTWIDDYLNNLDLNGYKEITLQTYKTIYLKKKIEASRYDQLENEVKRLNYIRNPNLIVNDTFNVNIEIQPKSKKNKIVYKKIISFFYHLHKISYFKTSEIKNRNSKNLIINLEEKKSYIKYNNTEIEFPLLIDNKTIFSPILLETEDLISMISLSIPISFLLMQNGYIKKAGDLILNSLIEYVGLLEDEFLNNVLHHISIILIKSGKGLYIIELAGILKENGKIEIAGLLTQYGNFLVNFDENIKNLYKTNYIIFNESLLPLFKSNEEKGMCYYNMANVLRKSPYVRKAISYYFQAKRYLTEYRNRSYWWAELAGCFFVIDKLKFSEKFYKRALAFGEKTIPVKALMADAILYQGRYSEAKELFKSYLEDSDYLDASFVLKEMLSVFLSKHFSDRPREPLRATLITENAIRNISNKEEKIKEFILAINLDPLCGYAWQSYSVAITNDKKEERFLEPLVVSILQPEDIEYWTHTMFLMISENIMESDPFLFWAFANEAIDRFGHTLILCLEFFLKDLEFPEDKIKEMVETFRVFFQKLAASYTQERPQFILRFYENPNLKKK